MTQNLQTIEPMTPVNDPWEAYLDIEQYGKPTLSSKTMLNKRTLPHLAAIHKQVVEEMKCARHEIHPMYPSDFASNLEVLSLEETSKAIHNLLDNRNDNTWMLFGTLPFYPCSDDVEQLELLNRIRNSKNVSVRNDPDGRSRLNVNIFTGEVIVTDFADTPAMGNIQTDSLPAMLTNWLSRPLAKSIACHCPAVKCLGPNLLVKNAYYPEVDFTKKTSQL